MKPSNFTNLLECGAVLRIAADDWCLLEGPFEKISQIEPHQLALFQPGFFSETQATYWIPKSFYRLTDAELKSLCEGFQPPPQPKMQWHEASLESFQKSFEAIQKRIHEDSLQKAVPIVFEKSSDSVSTARRCLMIQALLKAPTNLYVFGFWDADAGILGATPEVLLRQKGSVLSTMALAGTCPKVDSAQRLNLLEDPKERHEHELVVQDILTSLKSYGQMQMQGPEILELPTLFHLKTAISCHMSETSSFRFFEACRRLHPTPALGVSPRSYGYEWMKELPEQQDRGDFGGPWGLQWAQDEALCLVAIRNIQWDKNGSKIGSGCGIVSQSLLEQEWRELFQKRQSVKKILGLDS